MSPLLVKAACEWGAEGAGCMGGNRVGKGRAAPGGQSAAGLLGARAMSPPGHGVAAVPPPRRRPKATALPSLQPLALPTAAPRPAGVLWSISPRLVAFLLGYAALGTAVSTCCFGRLLMRLQVPPAGLRRVVMLASLFLRTRGDDEGCCSGGAKGNLLPAQRSRCGAARRAGAALRLPRSWASGEHMRGVAGC